jgi:hypothetical protein
MSPEPSASKALGASPSTTMSGTCAICLAVPYRPARLDACTHQFCLACVYKWSQASNACPYCRAKFHTIVDESDPDCAIAVEDLELRAEPTADAFDLTELQQGGCVGCGSGEAEDALLICDSCDAMYGGISSACSRRSGPCQRATGTARVALERANGWPAAERSQSCTARFQRKSLVSLVNLIRGHSRPPLKRVRSLVSLVNLIRGHSRPPLKRMSAPSARQSHACTARTAPAL